MNYEDTFNLVSKTANENYTSLRKLADINMNAWDQLASKQLEIMKLCFDTSTRQVEMGKDVKRADEMFGKQVELARELGEKLVESNEQVVEILNSTRDEYQGWVEAGTEQARTRMEQVAPAKARKAA